MDPITVEGTGDPPNVEHLDSVEKALQQLAELNANILAETGEKEKLIAGLAEVTEAVHDLQLREKSKMQFESGTTKQLLRGGMQKAMLASTDNEQLRNMQVMSDDLHIVNGLLSQKQGYAGIESLKSFREWETARTDFEKAMDTAEAGAGTEWVPAAGVSGELMRAIELKQRVASLFQSYPMPTPEHKRPLLTDYGTAYRATQNVDAASLTKAKRTKLGTDDVLFVAEKIMGRLVWTKEMDEDSIVAMLPEIKAALAIAHARAFDYAIIDGQITAVIDSGDDPSGDANDVRNCWDGIRYYCSAGVNNTMVDLGAAWNGEGILSVRKLLGKAGIYPDECVWIPSISEYYKLLTLKDAAGAQLVMSMEKIGAAATVVTGQLGTLFGTPVVPSEFIREDLNVAGIHDGITETKTVLPIVHRPGWEIGRHKSITVETDKDIENDVLMIVTRERADFQNMMPYATQVSAALGFNIAP